MPADLPSRSGPASSEHQRLVSEVTRRADNDDAPGDEYGHRPCSRIAGTVDNRESVGCARHSAFSAALKCAHLPRGAPGHSTPSRGAGKIFSGTACPAEFRVQGPSSFRDPRSNGALTCGWSRSCRLCQAGPVQSVTGGRRVGLPEECGGVRAFLESTQPHHVLAAAITRPGRTVGGVRRRLPAPGRWASGG